MYTKRENIRKKLHNIITINPQILDLGDQMIPKVSNFHKENETRDII